MKALPLSIEIDEGMSEIIIDGRLISLTATEIAILAFLGRHPRWRRSRSELLSAVDPTMEQDIYERTIDSHIKRMRAKGVSCIQTVYGLGYIWRGPSPVFADKPDLVSAETAESCDVTLRCVPGLSVRACLAAVAEVASQAEKDGLTLVSVQIRRAGDADQAQGLAASRPIKRET